MNECIKEIKRMFPEQENTKHPLMYDKDYYHFEIVDSHVKIKQEVSCWYPDQFDESGNCVKSCFTPRQTGFFLVACHEYLKIPEFERHFTVPDLGLTLLDEQLKAEQ